MDTKINNDLVVKWFAGTHDMACNESEGIIWVLREKFPLLMSSKVAVVDISLRYSLKNVCK